MNGRQFFASASTTALITGVGLGSGRESAAQLVKPCLARPSAPLALATQVSLVDTYNSQNSASFLPSATASLRLSAAFFEDQGYGGQTANDEAYVLGNTDAFVAYQQSADDANSMQQALATLGLSGVTLPDPNSVSSDERVRALGHIQNVGLAQYYRHELHEITKNLPGVSAAGIPAKWKEGLKESHLQRVNLDKLSCQIIGAGACIAAFTGNAPGAFILGMWLVVSCTS